MKNLKFEMLLISSLILKKSDWIAEQTNAIFENFQKSKMTQISIWDLSILKILSKNWLIFWFEYCCYHWNSKKWSICKNQKMFFRRNLESIEWFQCRCNEKKIDWYDDSKFDFWWNIEFIEWIKENDQFAMNLIKIMKKFRNR